MGPTVSTGNAIADVFIIVICVLLGGTGGGAIVALRKDRRQKPIDEATLTETLQRLAKEAVVQMEGRHAQERLEWSAERSALTRRVEQLEQAMRDAKITIPQPLPALRSVR